MAQRRATDIKICIVAQVEENQTKEGELNEHITQTRPLQKRRNR